MFSPRLSAAKKITQNLEINQIWGVVVQEKESNMVFFSRWKFPTLGMTVQHGHPLGWKLPSRTEPHIRFLYSHSTQPNLIFWNTKVMTLLPHNVILNLDF